MGVVVLFLALGFVVSIFLAWAYELTPEGIKRTKDVPLAESVRHITGQRLNYIVMGLLALAARELGATFGLEQALRSASTDDLEAYRLYLAALAEPVFATAEAGERALALLEQALRLDPEFAEAWSQKSSTLSVRYVAGNASLEDAEEAALRAIALAPNRAEGYAARATVLAIRGDWLGATREFELARERGSLGESMNFMLSVGHLEEGRERLGRRLDAQPLDQGALAFLMLSHEMLGDPEAADAVYGQGQRVYDSCGVKTYGIGLNWAATKSSRSTNPPGASPAP